MNIFVKGSKKKIDKFKLFLKKKLNEFNDIKVRIVVDIDLINMIQGEFMVYKIKKYGEDVLKQIVKEVELSEINDEFRQFLDDMVEIMYEIDGVGFVVS